MIITVREQDEIKFLVTELVATSNVATKCCAICRHCNSDQYFSDNLLWRDILGLQYQLTK